MNWPQKRIGDYLRESSIETSAPSAERRIRVRLNAEGIEKRPLIAETEGATRYFQRSAGQFIYGKQNLHKGAFGVVPPELDGFESSSDLPAFDVTDGLRPEWLEYFLKQGNFYKSLVGIAKGAATKRIQPEALFAVELPVPPPKVQDEIIKRMDRCALEHTRLEYEITNQQSLLAKLKQAILQEAIQGKLTADWRAAHPDVEPASQLLNRIQAEKARLIAAKKLRPEKPLPKITPAEIPFEIPKGWEWCRLGQAIRLMNGNSFESGDFKKGTGVKCIKITNAGVGEFVETDDTLPLGFDKAYAKYQVFSGDLILALTRPYIATGLKISRCPESYDGALLNQRVAAIRPIDGFLDSDFAFLFLGSDFVLRGYQAEFESKGQQPNLKSEHVTHLRLPLPPLAEQAEIVERVDALMTTCRLLEAEIEQARTHAAHLLQAVLKEAFAPASDGK